MNLSELRAQTKTYLMNTSTDTDSLSWSDAELDSYINEGAFYVQELGEFFVDTENLPVSSNTATYTVADNQQQLIRTTFDRNFLPQTNEYELDRDTRSTWRNQTASTPVRFYSPQFNQVTLWPPPNADGELFSFEEELGEVLQVDSSVVSVSDDFNRANENPLAAPWASVYGTVPLKLVGNKVESTALLPSFGGAVYSGISWPKSQRCKFTVGTLINGNSVLSAFVRYTYDGALRDTFYEAFVNALGTIEIDYVSNGLPSDPSRMLAIGSQVVNPGDTVELVSDYSDSTGVTTLTMLINDLPVLTATDSSIQAAGSPGILAAGSIALTDAVFDNFEASGVVPDYIFSSELGVAVQLIDTRAPYSLFKLDEGATGSLNAEFGVIADYASDEGNIGTIFVGVIPELVEDADVPQIPEYSHPAIPMYAVARALARDGEFQDLNLASSWFDAFKDWMDASLNVRGKEWPFTVTSLEPWQKGNDLNRRLQSVGLPGFIRQ